MKKFILTGLLLTGSVVSLMADIVYVTALPQGCTVTTDPGNGCGLINTDGTYTEVGFTLANTGIKGSAPGRPTTANSSRYYQSSAALVNTEAGVDIRPVLAVPGAVYQIDYNWNGNAGNSSQDVLMSATCTGGALSFTDTTLFRRSNGIAASWKFMGFLTNDVDSSTPTVSFRYASGLVSAAAPGNRLLFDCWRFTLYEPCLTVPVVSVTGPLSTNLNEVVVTGVSGSATEVKVYQNSGSGMVLIGSKTTGITAGNNTVTVSGLVKTAQVAATQTIGGQEGCVPASGTIVGGGANPSLRMAFSVRYDPALTGPAGSAGTSGANVYFLGASSVLSGSPEQGAVLLPTNEWQTVTFARNTDSSVRWTGVGPATLEGEYGSLDGLGLACEGDPGSFDIYIDDLANGTNGILQDFEAATDGQAGYGFVRPGISGTTSGNILTAPDSAIVTTNTAFSGNQCLRVRWQFVDGALNRWVRFVTSGSVPVANPQVGLNEPVSVKVLVLPVGATPPPPPPPVEDLVITFSYTGNTLTLNWTDANAVLQEATALTGSPGDWSDVVGATTGHQVNASSGTKFYRLKK